MKLLKKVILAVIRWARSFIATHRAISGIAIGLLILFVTFSALIGMPPIGYVLILAGIATPTVWYVLRTVRREGSGEGRLTAQRFLGVVVIATLVTFLAIQLVPYGKNHSNPPVTGEPQWANTETRDLMVRACFGCHSNQVVYPAYASVAPISWVVQSHIDEDEKSEENLSSSEESSSENDENSIDTTDLMLMRQIIDKKNRYNDLIYNSNNYRISVTLSLRFEL